MAADDRYSYFQPIGYMNSSSCGYCHSSATIDGKPVKRFMFYATTKSIKASFYQTLVDRSWRRSGSLIYRPNQREACCPHYTIRLDASAYRPSRDHRQTVNRFNRHVVGDEYTKVAQRVRPLSREEAKRRDTTFDVAERLHEAESQNLPPLQATRTRRRNRKPKLGQEPARTESAEEDAVPPSDAKTVDPAHRFEVTLETDTYTDEKYDIFVNYQKTIHNEPDHKISKSTFTSFLCNSPLRREVDYERDKSGGIREKKLGSYHQCYRLDGKLVAVGVIDLLPHCVSAVYFMYDASIHQFNPGKLSAMREIALAVEGGYKWWYSGFYIASCPKMRYKLGFTPQYMLDPETHQWDAFDAEAQALYCHQPYVSLSRERRAKSGEGLADDEQRREPTVEDDPDAGNEHITHSLFRSTMPGMVPLEQMSETDIATVPILAPQLAEPFPASSLVSWDSSTLTDNASIKSKLAQMVALMGLDMIDGICLDYRT